ncbi:N-acetyltransferase [bacterium]|nr:N-acetyltransferase [bacterium]
MEDCESIRNIMNFEIQNRSSMYDEVPKKLEEVQNWFYSKMNSNFPVQVVEVGTKVCAYATYGAFRPKSAYRFTVEHSIYVHREFQGQGIGDQLMKWLIASIADNGYHSSVAGIDSGNTGSLKFHEKYGFVEVARFKEIGFKFDRWLDLIFMQKIL